MKIKAYDSRRYGIEEGFQMHKWYFCGVDGRNIAWAQDRDKAFRFASKEKAEQESALLNSGHHLITPSDGGPRVLFHNFRAAKEGHDFIVCFDAETATGGQK